MWTLNSQPTVVQPMPEWSLSHTCMFPVREITAFLHVGTQDSISALDLGAILNYEITSKKHKNAKDVVLKQTVKRTLVCSRRAETRLAPPQLRRCMWNDPHFSQPCAWPKITMEAQWVQILRLLHPTVMLECKQSTCYFSSQHLDGRMGTHNLWHNPRSFDSKALGLPTMQ